MSNTTSARPLNLNRWKALKAAMPRVHYQMGAKADPIDCLPSHLRELDCSGLVSYFVHNTSQTRGFPDGSVDQHQWCEDNLRALRSYDDLAYTANDPARLFIGFVEPIYQDGEMIEAGHVWFVWRGLTYESHGGYGVSSRGWLQPFMTQRHALAYEWPTE